MRHGRHKRACLSIRLRAYAKRKGQKGAADFLVVLLGALVCGVLAGVVLWFVVFRDKPADAPAGPSSKLEFILPSTSQPQQTSESEPEPPPEDNTDEEIEETPVPLSLTDEELERLDGMLAAWAAKVTAPVGQEAEPAEGAEEAPKGKVFTPENYGHNVSVFFMDLDSGLTYIYNGGVKYEIASLNKAPYAMYLYDLASQGELDLDQRIMVTQAMLASSQDNSGRLKEDETLPREFSVEELIYEMLRYSDTGALRILLTHYNAAGFGAWAEDVFDLAYPEDVRQLMNARITSVDAGAYLKEIYRFIDENEYGMQLYEHLTNTRNLMIRSEYPVARKYGWDLESYHDMAIVYADHPYLLAILTDKSYGTWGETAMFALIAETFEEIMSSKWAAAS